MTFFNIGPISIDLPWIIAFFTGVFTGFLLMALWYLIAVVASLNKNTRIRNVDEADVDLKEVEWLINDAHETFKDKDKRNEAGFGPHLMKTAMDLSKDIASKFYPNSKYPYLELSLDETLLLLRYVSDRFNELLNKPILKMFKGMTLRRLMTLNDAKVKVDNNLIVKTSNKLKISEIFKNSMMALNVVNPIYWFKKLVVNNVINIVLVKLGLVVISLTGEETYKIYSKNVFNEEREIDTGIEDIYKTIEDAMKEE